jgi:hypothetical protein
MKKHLAIGWAVIIILSISLTACSSAVKSPTVVPQESLNPNASSTDLASLTPPIQATTPPGDGDLAIGQAIFTPSIIDCANPVSINYAVHLPSFQIPLSEEHPVNLLTDDPKSNAEGGHSLEGNAQLVQMEGSEKLMADNSWIYSGGIKVDKVRTACSVGDKYAPSWTDGWLTVVFVNGKHTIYITRSQNEILAQGSYTVINSPRKPSGAY